MKKSCRILLLIALPSLLSGCFRTASYPTMNLSWLTPQAETNFSPAVNAGETVTPTPELDPAAKQALRVYPLWIGSSWVYEFLGFDGEKEVTWRVVETVIDTQLVQGFFAAQVERIVELEEGAPSQNFPSSPEEGKFWLVFADGGLYRTDLLDGFNPDIAWLDLVIPLPQDGAAWNPDSGLRVLDEPTDYGMRTSSEPFQQVLSMGGTYTCYNITTQFERGASKSVFCEGVGFVYLEYLDDEQDSGYRAELTGFSLQ